MNVKSKKKTDFRYADYQNSFIRKLLKRYDKWYLPDSGIWDERYMNEKRKILTKGRNLKEFKIIKRFIKGMNKEILDAPCGYGRLSNLMVKNGYKVTGIDINKYFIDIAKEEAIKNKLEVEYKVIDIFKFRAINKYDVVLNIFTSLGYFESEEKNEQFIKKICSFVRPGGILVIEIINPLGLLKKYQSRKDVVVGRGLKISYERHFDYMTSTNITQTTERYPDGKIVKLANRIRLYYPHELIRICKKYGLENIEVLNKDGKKNNILNSLRMWLIFKKYEAKS